MADMYPPFDLKSDMLLVMGIGETFRLRARFPGVPFLSTFNRTPMLIWFSRITQACYLDSAGRNQCDTDETVGLYNDITLIAPLRNGSVFVPAVFTTSLQNVQVAHTYYAMPKALAEIQVDTRRNEFVSRLQTGADEGAVHARRVGKGRFLATLAARFLPWRTMRVWFSTRSFVRALLQALPRLYLAPIRTAQLYFPAAGFSQPLWIFPIAIYAPETAMQLPLPQTAYARVAQEIPLEMGRRMGTPGSAGI